MAFFSLNHREIRQGDIVLTRDRSKTSKWIQFSTQGEFSHAIIYLGNYSLIEATLEGVHVSNSLRKRFESPDDVSVYRHKKNLSPNELQSMCDWARTNYAAQYNLLGAIGAGIGVEFESERKQTFCSKFACMAYQNIGHSVVDNPSIATPSDISKSGHLYRIDKYLVKIEKEDEDSEPNQNERQKALINAFMMNVREIAGKNVQTFNDVDQIVLENRELDKPISDLLVQSGYLNMWQWDVEICPFHYDLDNLGAHVKKWGFTKEDLMDYCADQIKACDENERRYANNLAVCEDLMSKRPRQFIRLKINLYNTLIRQTEIRKEVAEKGSQLVIE